MTLQNRRAVRREIQDGYDPLDYWLEQERAQGLDLPETAPAPGGKEAANMPGGWWLLPVMVMALPIWGLISWLLLRR